MRDAFILRAEVSDVREQAKDYYPTHGDDDSPHTATLTRFTAAHAQTQCCLVAQCHLRGATGMTGRLLARGRFEMKKANPSHWQKSERPHWKCSLNISA